MTPESNHNRVVRWFALAAALIVLDVSLTFANVWPTPAITWHGQLSVELAVGVLLLASASRSTAPSRAVLNGIAVIWVLLVIGRYAEVTAPALYGRPVNLYWDSRHVSAVAAMLARAASTWRVALALIVAALVPVLIYIVLRWAIGRVAEAIRRPEPRRALVVIAGLALLWFAGQRLAAGMPRSPSFSTPVTVTYGRQARLLTAEITGRSAKTLGPSPSFDSDLARVRGADVSCFFSNRTVRSATTVLSSPPVWRRRGPNSGPTFVQPAAMWCRRTSSRRPSAETHGWRTSAF